MGWDAIRRAKRAVGTALISLGPALEVNPVMLPVYALTSVIVWWFAPPAPQSLGHLIANGWKLPFLITFVYGVTNFLYGKTRARLERRNVELQGMVQSGAARLEIHEQELQRAREIQQSLLTPNR